MTCITQKKEQQNFAMKEIIRGHNFAQSAILYIRESHVEQIHDVYCHKNGGAVNDILLQFFLRNAGKDYPDRKERKNVRRRKKYPENVAVP